MKGLGLSLIFLCSSLSFAQTQDERACRAAYQKLYQKDELRISLFMGYNDQMGAVVDIDEKARVVNSLTDICQPGTEFCNFKRDPDDAEVFTKTIKGPGGKTKTIRLSIANSAVSYSDNANLSYYAKQQQARSLKVKEKFLSSLKTDDVILYSGHARRGTGPGFQPMTKADWLRAAIQKPVLKEMLQTLKTSPKKPAIIGMLVCEGENYYGKLLHEAAPDSALLLTRQATAVDENNNLAMSLIDSLLRQNCMDAVRSEFHAITQVIFPSTLEKKTTLSEYMPELYGFFEPIRKKFPEPTSAASSVLHDWIYDQPPVYKSEAAPVIERRAK